MPSKFSPNGQPGNDIVLICINVRVRIDEYGQGSNVKPPTILIVVAII